MSELIIAGFKGEFTADQVLLDMEKMQQTHNINLDDAVVAIRKPDGTVKIRHSNILVFSDAAMGSQFGMIFAGPAGLIVGGLIGAAVGKTVKFLKQIGIMDDFVKDVAKVLEPGSSAIFLRVHKAISENIVNELKKFNGTLLRSSLSIEDEKALIEELRETLVSKL